MAVKNTFEFIPATLGIKPRDSIANIKQRLRDRYGLAVDEQHVFDAFGELDDKGVLEDLHVVPDQKLSLFHECDKRTPHGIRCLLVGDGAVGKKGLIDAFRNSFDPSYKLNPFYCSAGSVCHDGVTVNLHLRKHPGQPEYDRCIASSFPNSDVFVIVFSVIDPPSLAHVEHWWKLIRQHGPAKAPVLLVGTKCDLRGDQKLIAAMRTKGLAMVTHAAMETVANHIDAYGLYECSAKSREGLQTLFAAAVVAEKTKSHKKSFLSRILGKSDKHADVHSTTTPTITTTTTTTTTTTATAASTTSTTATTTATATTTTTSTTTTTATTTTTTTTTATTTTSTTTTTTSTRTRTTPTTSTKATTTNASFTNTPPKPTIPTTSKAIPTVETKTKMTPPTNKSIPKPSIITPVKTLTTGSTRTTAAAANTSKTTVAPASTPPKSIFRFRSPSTHRRNASRSRSGSSRSRSTSRNSNTAPADDDRSRSSSIRRAPPPPPIATLASRRSSAPTIVGISSLIVSHDISNRRKSTPAAPPSTSSSLAVPTSATRRSLTPNGTSSARNGSDSRSHISSRKTPPPPVTTTTSTARGRSTSRTRRYSDSSIIPRQSSAPPLPPFANQPPAPSDLSSLKDGSVHFWIAELRGMVDADDITEVATRLAAAGFKKKHARDFSREDLKEAGLNSGIIKDLLDKQQRAPTSTTGLGAACSLESNLIANIAKIPDEALKLEQIIGEGTFSVVWRATWTRTLSVGSVHNEKITVAVKMSKSATTGFSPEMLREVAVMSSLPHQNILALLGVCESTPPKIVYELMTTDLSKLIATGQMKRHFQLRVLRDISAGACHLHAHGIVHRDLKPGNVLIRDDQVKICDFGSSKDLQQTSQKMSVAGTLDYMAPEIMLKKPVGKPADVWAFGVLVFECLVGRVPSSPELPKLIAELKEAQCLPQLADIFAQCHVRAPEKRPTMAVVYQLLQKLLIQDAQDSQRLKEELRVAEAQDSETYRAVWVEYAAQSHMPQLLSRVKELGAAKSHAVVQPVSASTMESLIALANVASSRLHEHMRDVVESNGGRYILAPRKSEHRALQKVEQEYAGDFRRLLDLERATGGFDEAHDFVNCLHQLASRKMLTIARAKDRLNNPLTSGYRDVLLNVCDPQSGFVGELQLNFNKIAQIKSQTHRFYEMTRVMVLGA